MTPTFQPSMQKLIPLTSPKPNAKPAPPFHVSAAQYEVITLLGMGDPQRGLLALLETGLRHTHHPNVLRKHLAIYNQHKYSLTPKSLIAKENNMTLAAVGKIISDFDALLEWDKAGEEL